MYLHRFLFPILFCFVYIQLFKFFIYLPAETGTWAVRVGIPAPGRDRDTVPLSELSRDLTVNVDGLGRAKNKFSFLIIIY